MKEETKYCPHCGKEISIELFGKNSKSKDGLSFYCKEYSRDYQRSKANDFDHIIKNRWSSINQRTVNGKYANEPSVLNNPQHQAYLSKNITLDMSESEFWWFMYKNASTYYSIELSGGKASVDRINDQIGYRLDNLQIIPLHQNKSKSIGKTCKVMSAEELKKHSEYQKFAYDVRKLLRGLDEMIQEIEIGKVLRKCDESLNKCDEILGIIREGK